MAGFRSLSTIIRTQVAQAQLAQVNNISSNSATARIFGQVIPAINQEIEEVNVLKWGNSHWGIEKVTSKYKPD